MRPRPSRFRPLMLGCYPLEFTLYPNVSPPVQCCRLLIFSHQTQSISQTFQTFGQYLRGFVADPRCEDHLYGCIPLSRASPGIKDSNRTVGCICYCFKFPLNVHFRNEEEFKPVYCEMAAGINLGALLRGGEAAVPRRGHRQRRASTSGVTMPSAPSMAQRAWISSISR